MTDVETVAVLGAGDMGHGVAELCAMNGFQVRLRDIDEEVLGRAMEKVRWSLDKLAERKQITEQEAEDAFDRITATTDLDEAVGGVDLVIEAVPEDLALKQRVFAEVEQAAPVDAVLASNTSTMRITEIGEKMEHPERLVGMHFFNPVLLMDLIEIIPSEQSSEEAVATAEAVATRIGKTHVTLDKDTAGFVTSRLIGVWMGAAFALYEHLMKEKEAIDAAMKFKAGFPMGPFELADYTGLDIAVHAGDYMAEHLGEGYRTSQVVRELVDQGHLGKKTGQGFYGWEEGRMVTQLSAEMTEDVEPRMVMAVVANEAARLLADGVASAEDIDLAMRNGCAFPKGPLEWADSTGLDKVLETLEELREEADEPILEPAGPLVKRVEAGKLGRATGEGFHTYEDAQDASPGGLPQLEAVTLSVDAETRVGTLTLSRAHRLHAINDQLIDDLERGLEALDAHEDVRAIVLTAEGEKAFCVGADLQDADEFTPAMAVDVVRRGHMVCLKMEKLATPVVAAVNGYAFGGGLELTLPADFRVAARRAKFALPEVTLGLLPAMGGTQRLPKLIGLSAAKEFAMIGERIDAERAQELGLVHRVYDNDTFREEAHAFAAELAKRAPIAMKLAKQLLNAAPNMDITAGMEAEATAFGVLSGTDDVVEGVSSMFMKKEPDFKGK